MSQHYTLLTVEVSERCNKCGKNTPHRVADRRLQYCIPCWQKSAAESIAAKVVIENAPAEQQYLFSKEQL